MTIRTRRRLSKYIVPSGCRPAVALTAAHAGRLRLKTTASESSLAPQRSGKVRDESRIDFVRMVYKKDDALQVIQSHHKPVHLHSRVYLPSNSLCPNVLHSFNILHIILLSPSPRSCLLDARKIWQVLAALEGHRGSSEPHARREHCFRHAWAAYLEVAN